MRPGDVHKKSSGRLRALLAALLLIVAAAPSAASAVTYVFSTPIAGDSVEATLTLTDAPGGDGVDITISIPPGEGDLLGLFGNVTTESMLH